MQLVLTTELLLEAYRQGLFPMAYSAGSPYIHWVCPEMRGQLSIDALHISKSLKKIVKSGKLQGVPYCVKTDQAFGPVLDLCAESTETRPETWINQPIMDAYRLLHRDGHAHSVEVWQEDVLVGGLYGLAIGSVFFGESMFSRTPNASKVALVHLAARLWRGGFSILDTQFVNDHLKQFGVYEMPYKSFKTVLAAETRVPADFRLPGRDEMEMVRDYLAFL